MCCLEVSKRRHLCVVVGAPAQLPRLVEDLESLCWRTSDLDPEGWSTGSTGNGINRSENQSLPLAPQIFSSGMTELTVITIFQRSNTLMDAGMARPLGIFTLSLAMCRHGCSRMVVFWPSDQYLQNDSISKISTFFPVTLWMLRNCWDLWQAISIHQKLVSWTDGDLWIFSFGISPSSCAAEPLGWWGDGVMSQDQLAAHVTAANVSAMLYVCGSGAQKAAAALVGGRNRNQKESWQIYRR